MNRGEERGITVGQGQFIDWGEKGNKKTKQERKEEKGGEGAKQLHFLQG